MSNFQKSNNYDNDHKFKVIATSSSHPTFSTPATSLNTHGPSSSPSTTLPFSITTKEHLIHLSDFESSMIEHSEEENDEYNHIGLEEEDEEDMSSENKHDSNPNNNNSIDDTNELNNSENGGAFSIDVIRDDDNEDDDGEEDEVIGDSEGMRNDNNIGASESNSHNAFEGNNSGGGGGAILLRGNTENSHGERNFQNIETIARANIFLQGGYANNISETNNRRPAQESNSPISTRIEQTNNILMSMGRDNNNGANNSNINNMNRIMNNFLNRANLSFEEQIEELLDNFTYLVSTEKVALKEERLKLVEEKEKFYQQKKTDLEKLQEEKIQWYENNKKVEDLYEADGNIIDLDIGGTHKITTTKSTLTKAPHSALAAMFSGRHKISKHNDRIFIDRDGAAFIHIISFLRNGKIPIFKSKIEEHAFYEELDFWQIPLQIKDDIENGEPKEFDPVWCASTLILDSKKITVRKNEIPHGIVFAENPLDITNTYIEFKVNINVPSRGRSHLFVGIVDKSKYRHEMLLSTFWKDSPSCFYWDVWNTKLIKTDENGNQTGVISGYGCSCEEDYDMRIGIEYNAKNKTISYYKNGINQGVAFKNVGSGYYPSLDLWFESGSVEILPVNVPIQKEFL